MLCFSNSSFGSVEVAITVDDLPITGQLPVGGDRLVVAEKFIQVFQKHHMPPVYGFINGKGLQESKEGATILEKWIDSGNLLGNHTFHHYDLATSTVGDYVKDIVANEPILSKLEKPTQFKFFRYPFLAEGETLEKREGVRDYLFQNSYKIAEVSLDFFDYEWVDPYVRCKNKNNSEDILWLKKSYVEQSLNAIEISHLQSMLLFGRDIKYILLIHIGALEAEVIDDLLSEYEKQGVKFISLETAVSDSAYKIDPKIARERTYTFLTQVMHSKNQKNPARVQELFDSLPEKKLEQICK